MTNYTYIGLLKHPLKPDLILSLDAYAGQNYELLSAIAPTVPIQFDKAKLSFKENFRFIAQLVGQEPKAEKVLNQYQKRVEELQSLLGIRLKKIEISVIEYLGKDTFYLQGRNIIYAQVLNDIGLRLKPVLLKQNEPTTLSIEVLDKYDADILFIVNVGSNKKLSSYFQIPY
jgi:iron complex transport system substrate-binding protein